MIVQRECFKCGFITTIHGEFDCCQECQTEFVEEEEHDGSTSERGYSEEEHQDSKANLPCPPLVGAFWGPHGKLVYFNNLIPFKFRSPGPNLRTYSKCQLLFDFNLMNTDDPFVGPSELGIGSAPTLKAGGHTNSKSNLEDDEYSFQSDFVNHFNPTMSPALESDVRTTPVNPAFSFESPFVSSNALRRSFSRDFDIGVASNIGSTDTVIIRDYSRLFSFNKSFAINSKILPSVEACRHNAKLSKTLGLPKSVQRAWNISQVICGSEVLDKKQRKNLRRRTALIDPVRTLATHLLLRFIKAQNYQMVTLLWGVFHHAGLHLDEVWPNLATGQEEKTQDKWIQRIHEFIEGYADELFRINAYLQRAQILKCTPSSILQWLREQESTKRESRSSSKTIIAATSPVTKRKRSCGTINRDKATLQNSLYLLGANLQVKTPRTHNRPSNVGHKSRTPQFQLNSKSGVTKATYWKKPFGIQMGRSQSDTDISMQLSPKPSNSDNLDLRRGSRNDFEWSKYGVRRFLPTWNSRMRGTEDINPQRVILPAQPPDSGTSPCTNPSQSEQLRCYVCELTVRSFWVRCSICGRGGHLEHMLTPDLEIGHFCKPK